VLSLLSAILHASPGSANARFGHELDLKKFLLRREDAPRRKADKETVAKNHRAVSPWMRGCLNPRDAPPEATQKLPTETTYSFQRPETPEIVGESASRRTKVLVCAPSNAALDEIVMRIMHSGLLGPDGNAYSPTLVRVGVNAHRGVEKVSMETLVRERVGSDDEDNDERTVNVSEKKFERALERDRVKLAILDEASVVCSTLSFSGSGMFARMTKKFDVVVVDEAAQAVEPSTLVPLCYGAKQAFLVGDPKQLPATVLSSAATAKGYTRSLFKRFEECGYPVYLLKTQYRMHPEIRKFPSSAFYGDALTDGPAMRKRATRPWHTNPLFKPFVFFDVNGTERRPDGASWANDDEARLVAALVKRLISDYPSLLNEDEVSGAGVGVISPYKAQVKVIRKFLEQALGSEKARFVDVNSVDGFQGREKEVCVFSVTRAPRVDKKDTAEETKRKKNLLGFVADERRVNVGLTRARSSLLVVGSAKALQTDVHWGGLVKSATDRKLIVKPTGGKTAAAFDAFVAKHSAEYDEDDLSGDEDADAVYDDDEDEDVRDGETTTEGDPSLNGDGEDAERKKHVHEPEWTGAVGKSAAERRDDANKARDLARDDADDAAAVDEIVSGFAPGGLRDELVTEASNVRGVGQADDYAGAGNDDDDGDLDAFAQAPEPAAKKRTAGARSKAPAEKISNAEKEKDKKRGAEKTATGAPPKRARGKK
jgi:senataxin